MAKSQSEVLKEKIMKDFGRFGITSIQIGSTKIKKNSDGTIVETTKSKKK